MKVQIGEKIKQLRNRDGRTQEMLANAIGVTSQAVSRWEGSGGYPDMETIPAIANYFHVTIDELFGYDGDREQKIQELLIKTDAMVHGMRDMEEAIALLQNAAEEFPAETRIQLRLGNALTAYGFMKSGARRSKASVHQDSENMVAFKRQNQEFVAALAIYEKVLPTITEPDDRISVLKNMILLYALRGEYEKAEELAQKQNSVIISRECLLIHAAVEEKRNRYEGEALLALLWQMTNVVLLAVGQRYRLKSSHTGIRAALAMIALYQEILDDGNYGFGHYAMASLYSLCARCAVEQGHIEEAAGYLAEYKSTMLRMVS